MYFIFYSNFRCYLNLLSISFIISLGNCSCRNFLFFQFLCCRFSNISYIFWFILILFLLISFRSFFFFLFCGWFSNFFYCFYLFRSCLLYNLLSIIKVLLGFFNILRCYFISMKDLIPYTFNPSSKLMP